MTAYDFTSEAAAHRPNQTITSPDRSITLEVIETDSIGTGSPATASTQVVVRHAHCAITTESAEQPLARFSRKAIKPASDMTAVNTQRVVHASDVEQRGVVLALEACVEIESDGRAVDDVFLSKAPCVG